MWFPSQRSLNLALTAGALTFCALQVWEWVRKAGEGPVGSVKGGSCEPPFFLSEFMMCALSLTHSLTRIGSCAMYADRQPLPGDHSRGGDGRGVKVVAIAVQVGVEEVW